MPTILPKPPPSFASDSLALIGGQIIITFFSIGTAVITARALDAGGRGQFSLALLLASMLFMFTEFGLGSAGTRLIATKRWTNADIFTSHAFAITVRVLVTGLIGLALVLIARDAIFPGVPVEYLLLGLVQILPLSIAGSLLPLLLGLGFAKTYNRILILSSFLAVGSFSIGWVFIGLDVRTALLIQLGASFTTSVVIWRKMHQAAGGLVLPQLADLP